MIKLKDILSEIESVDSYTLHTSAITHGVHYEISTDV